MLRLLTLIFISALPVCALRRALYRWLFGFQIAKTARIAMFNLLDVRELVMKDHAQIRGFGNIFMSMRRVELEEHARIGAPRVGMNLFRGTAGKKHMPEAKLRMGKCSLIELFHYFDVCGDILLGNNVVVGGIRSVFFTHALYKREYEPIEIGEDTYVGSNCLFQMGVRVEPRCVVAMGSVVVKSNSKPGCMLAGVPARVVKPDAEFSMKDALMLRGRPYCEDGEITHA